MILAETEFAHYINTSLLFGTCVAVDHHTYYGR